MIEDLYIIRDGICLFSHEIKSGKQDSQLFAGFLTAINQFANSITEGEKIKQIIIGDSTLSFKIKRDIIFVFKQKDVHPSVLKQVTDEVIEAFFEQFEPHLQKGFDGSIDIFSKFTEPLNEILSKDFEIEGDVGDLDFITEDFDKFFSLDAPNYGQTDENKERIVCKICLMDIDEGTDDIIYCPNNHPVHEECFKEWIKHSPRCPYCDAEYSVETVKDINGVSFI